MEIKITHQGEDYIAVSLNGNEKELHMHDGQAVRHMMKAISTIHKAYA